MSFHSSTTCSRSAGERSGRASRRSSGSAATAARRLPRWASIRSAVAASKRSRLYSRARVSAPFPSVACKSRSKRAAAGWTGSGRTARPGSRSSLRIASWRRNITWKSGVEARLRSGESSSTSRSKGRSWCAWAASVVSWTRARRVAEPGIAGEIGAQHLGVDEEPDQPLGLDPRPIGDGRAEDHILLPSVAGEESGEPREKDHEPGRPAIPAEPRQGLCDLPRDGRAHPAAPPAPQRRPRMVGRQIEPLRRPGQALPPPAELSLQGRAGEPAPLPDRIVGVLDRQLREGRRLPGDEGGVERAQLAHQHPDRPAVRGHMVEGEEGPVRGLRQAEQGGPEERPAGEVERPQRLLPAEPCRFRFQCRLRQRGEIDQRHPRPVSALPPPPGPAGRHLETLRRSSAAPRAGGRSPPGWR